MPLRLTLEIVPGGDESRAEVIGTARIVNLTGAGEAAVANYAVDVAFPDGSKSAAGVFDFERSRGAWALVREALAAALARRPKS